MATTSEASRLQRRGSVMRFTWFTVGLLAMFGAAACGVGVDDVQGQQAAYGSTASDQTEQALATGPEGCPPPGGDEPPVTGNGGAPVDPGISNLPTDPVPWAGPNPVDNGDPMSDPMAGGVPLPGPGGTPTGR